MGISQACCVHDQRSIGIEAVRSVEESKRLGVAAGSCHQAQKEDITEQTESAVECDRIKAYLDHLHKTLPERAKNLISDQMMAFLKEPPLECVRKPYPEGSVYFGHRQPIHQTREGAGVLEFSSGEAILAHWQADWPAADFVFVDRRQWVAIGQTVEPPRRSEIQEQSGETYFSPMMLLGLVEEGLIFAGDVTVLKESEEYCGQIGSHLTYQGVGRLVVEEPDGSEITMSGTFKNGVLQGTGFVSYSHGTVYDGAFHQGIPHGKGKKRWLDKREYVGDWFMGDIQGTGEFLWPDGRRYCGSYVKNLKHGYGEYYFGDGSSYRGYWYQGLQHGEGKIVDLSGKVKSSGDWEKGVFQDSKKPEVLITFKPINAEKLESSPVQGQILKPKIDSDNSATTSPNTKKHMKTMSSLSLCEEYLNASLEVLPSAIRIELPVPGVH